MSPIRRRPISGEYGGLGIEVFANANDLTITVHRVFYGSPAQEGGVRPNDKIIAINGEEVTAYDLNYAVSQMRGEPGGEVTLTLLRENELFDVTLTRAVPSRRRLSTRKSSRRELGIFAFTTLRESCRTIPNGCGQFYARRRQSADY